MMKPSRISVFNSGSLTYFDIVKAVSKLPDKRGFSIVQLEKLVSKCQDLQKFLADGFNLADIRYAISMSELPKHMYCEVCGAEVHFNVRARRYNKACCKEHAKMIMLDTYHKTCLDKYGVDHVWKDHDIWMKGRQTTIDLYGDTNNRRKCEKTLFDRYGVTDSWHIPGVSEKRAKTMLRLYGTTEILSLSSTHEKAKATKSDKYGDPNYNNLEKIAQTKLDKYGSSTYNNPEKSKRTFTEHYGVDNNMKSEAGLSAYSESITKKYGVPFYVETDEFKQKASDSYFHKTGYTHPSHNPETQRKSKQSYFYGGQYFKTSWELAFYIYCVDAGYDIKHNPDDVFWYFDENEKPRSYHPDFRVGSELYEIKGGQFINKDGTYRNPYDKTHVQDIRYENKHKCMQEHNVHVISNKEIQPYLKYVETKYGKGYLKGFKKQKKV